jgi:branched-chain amino acid transport system permease protein
MRRLLPWIALLAAISVPMWLKDPYLLNAFITTGIFIIAAMSLNLLLGYTGQLSLGHVAFFGIGAYTSALVALGFDVELLFGVRVVHEPWPVWLGFVFAVLVSGLCGYLVGKLSFRVRGAYFVIVTISFAEVVRLVALNWVEFTQGPLALTSIPPMTLGLPGLGFFDFYSKQANYYLVLAVMAVSYVVIKRLVNSRIGRAMVALKENESLAVSVGIDVTRYLVLAAIVSAAIAGAAGSLYAHYLKIIDPDVFLFLYTVTMVIMVITGGKGTLAGPIVGGLIFGFIPVIARSFAAPEVQWILYGLFMILIVFVLPQGIVPAIEKWFGVRDQAKAAQDQFKAQDQSRTSAAAQTPTTKATVQDV